MNYGYDAQGNRLGDEANEEDARVQSVDQHADPNSRGSHERPDHDETNKSSRSSSQSGSDFSDDVELVIGETGNQPLDQPLVETVDLARSGRHRKDTESFLQLEAGPQHRTAHGQPLLIAGGQHHPLTRAEKHARRTQTFLETVAQVPGRVHTAALAGTLHHGKTSLLKMLLDGKSYPQRKDEEDRAISLKTHVVSSLVRGAQLCQSSRLLTLVDTPGHPDFIGEVAAGVRLADAVLFCVDAFESLDAHGERLLRHLVHVEGLPIVLVLTKVDRLILDLKLPPLDAYRKLRMVVEAVNNVIVGNGKGTNTAEGHSGGGYSRFLVAPQNGTVLFSSSKLGFLFSLETFSLKYASMYAQGTLDASCLAQRLWGQVTLEKGSFKAIANFRQRPTFVTFVLEPLYKIIAHSVAGKGAETLSDQLTKLPRSPLTAMQEAIRLFLGNPSGEGMDAVLSVLPTPQRRSEILGAAYQLTQPESAVFAPPARTKDGRTCTSTDKSEPLVQVAAVAPLVCVFTATSDVSGSTTRKTRKQHRTALVVRVLSGELRANPDPTQAQPRWSSSSTSASASEHPYIAIDDRSDEASPFTELRLQKLFVRLPDKGFVEVSTAYAGQVIYATVDGENGDEETGAGRHAGKAASRSISSKHLVLFGGPAAKALSSLDDGEQGTTDEEKETQLARVEQWAQGVRLWPLSCLGQHPIVHVSVELKDPSALPVFRRGLELLRRTTPGLDLRTEESGEFTVTGFGELHLDTALHQLRTSLCAGVKIGLSQPFVSFSETVLDAEGVLAVAGSRAKGSIGCTSGTLPRPLVAAVESAEMDLFPSDKAKVPAVQSRLRGEFGFDALDAQNVLALGPDKRAGPSLLIDDTLAEERAPGEKPLTLAQRNAIVAGFRDAMRSGPLVGEVVRGVCVRLILTEVATDKTVRVNELRSNTRLAVRRALFGARPRLLEPVLSADILCPPECLEKITDILQQRRGAVLGQVPIPATTLTRVEALVPAMDSFGLETQIRMMTHGQAFPMFAFRQWDVVPGDPYDATVHVGPLEPAKGYQLARDFVLKTRFRKGLSQELTADI